MFLLLLLLLLLLMMMMSLVVPLLPPLLPSHQFQPPWSTMKTPRLVLKKYMLKRTVRLATSSSPSSSAASSGAAPPICIFFWFGTLYRFHLSDASAAATFFRAGPTATAASYSPTPGGKTRRSTAPPTLQLKPCLNARARYYEGQMSDGQFHGEGTLYFPGAQQTLTRPSRVGHT
jgi:hypothetical protein